MAQDQITVDVENDWVEVTNEAYGDITFQVVRGGCFVYFTGTGTGAPGASAIGYWYQKGQGEAARPVAELSAHSTSRMWARTSTNQKAKVTVFGVTPV